MLPKINPTDVVVVVGPRGCGKTNLVKSLLQQFENLLVLDRMHEYQDTNATVCRFSPDLKEMIGLGGHAREKKIVAQPNHFSFDFSELLFCYSYTAENWTLVVEEADRIASTHQIGKWHSECVDTGRHHGIGLIEVTRRVNRLNTLISSNANHFFLFRSFIPADLAYLGEFIPPEALKEVSNLKPFECLYFCPQPMRFEVLEPAPIYKQALAPANV